MPSSVFRFLVPVTLCLMSVGAAAQAPLSAWSLESYDAAVQGCRAAIVDRATKDYLARHKLAENQLPKNFHQRIGPAIEPYLRTCDCSLTVLAKEVSFEEFNAQTGEVQQRLKSLVSPGGVCAAKPVP